MSRGVALKAVAQGPQLLGYFACIGLGYIIVEVALLQRLTLLLEHPAYAAAAVIAAMLVSSGVGSMLWFRTAAAGRARLVKIGFGGVLALLAAHTLFGYQIIHALLGLPLAAKIVCAALLLVPLGLLMGIPLPAGMSVAANSGPGAVAWCWAVNGAASVVASSLAVVLAMGFGFAAAIGVGLISYAGAGGLMWMMGRGTETAPAALP